MRYDRQVFFQKIAPGEYDPDTGNYGDDTVKETPRYASVMDTGETLMKLVYDGPKQGSLTIHLQNHYADPFDRIRVGEKVYSVDFSRKLRVKQAFVISEVQ